jgi:1,4-dihydroxy-2-naphthoate octaprenyltransferase
MKIETPRVEPTAAEPVSDHASHAGQPTGWRLWWLAVRPKTLSLSVAPVMAGTALAWHELGRVDPRPVLAAALAAVLIQAGTNLHNDVADALRGGDQPMRQGPPRVTALGWASPDQVRRAAFVAFALAALVGLYLCWLGGLPILALGAGSLVAGWAYSGGPRPIAYTPLGEVFVVAFFGLGAVGGTYYLQTQALSIACVLTGIALGLVAAGVLMANNYRDLEPDRLTGRRTLAITAGIQASKGLYAAFVLAPLVLLASPFGPSGGWLVLAALPVAIRLVRRFDSLERGPAFNLVLAQTARYQLLLAVLILIGSML